MDRQELTREVKAEYAQRADRESRNSFVAQAGAPAPEAYYEALLDQVLAGIDAGCFDDFATGRDIVEAVAADHDKWGIRL